jgi:hypothetical protein
MIYSFKNDPLKRKANKGYLRVDGVKEYLKVNYFFILDSKSKDSKK